jgi:hypothetical protein
LVKIIIIIRPNIISIITLIGILLSFHKPKFGGHSRSKFGGACIQTRWKRMPNSICTGEAPSEDGASVALESWEPKIFSAASE